MAELTDWIVAIATAAYVILTILILHANAQTNKLTQKQIESYNEAFLEEHRPIVTLCLVADGSLALLRLKNEGNRIAENVRIAYTGRVIINGDDQLNFVKCLEEMCSTELTLGSKSQWDLPVCLTRRLPNIEPSEVKFTISYTGDEKSFEEETTVHFNSYGWARMYRGSNEIMMDMEKDMKRCSESLSSISEQIMNGPS